MAKTEITGSWFPSGYHGHFRSKTRMDFMNEYRHLAKPQPPKKFFYRIKENRTGHQFSRHDNRESFMNDALIFEQGLGRKRFLSNRKTQNGNMLAWAPHEKLLMKSDKKAPSISTYGLDYQPTPTLPLKQKITDRPMTSFDEGLPVTTTYRYTHGKDNPNKEILLSADRLSLPSQPATFTKVRYFSSRTAGSRESVASCMSWHSATPRMLQRSQLTMALDPSPPKSAPVTSEPSPPKSAPAVVEPPTSETT